MADHELTNTQLEFRIRFEVRRGDDPHDVAEKYSVPLEQVLLLTAPPIPAKALAQRYTGLAVRALVETATQTDDIAARQKAAQALLDRGWGKPDQHVEQRSDISVNITWATDQRLSYQKPEAIEQAPAHVQDVAIPPVGRASHVQDVSWREPKPDNETKVAVDKALAAIPRPLKPEQP